MPICSLHNPFVPHVDGWPSEPVARLETTVALAQELGVRIVVVHLCVENMPARRLLGWRFNPCWWNSPDEWPRFPHL